MFCKPEKLERYAYIEVEEILPLITSPSKPDPDKRPSVHGVPCHCTGLRLYTFKTCGVACVACGIRGEYFAIERAGFEGSYHMNLYAVAEDGQEVLMTHDHVLSRGNGGTNRPENAQTMCTVCNDYKSRFENCTRKDTSRRDALCHTIYSKVKGHKFILKQLLEVSPNLSEGIREMMASVVNS